MSDATEKMPMTREGLWALFDSKLVSEWGARADATDESAESQPSSSDAVSSSGALPTNVVDDGADEASEGVKYMSLIDPFDNARDVVELSKYLSQNVDVVGLHLNSFNISIECARAMGRVLRENTSLLHLKMSAEASGGFGDDLVGGGQLLKGLSADGAVYVAGGLAANRSLRTVDLRVNTIGTRGFAALALALRTNHSVRSLLVDQNSNWDGKGLRAFVDVVQHNHSLRRLTFNKNKLDKDGAKQLTRALLRNRVLEAVEFPDSYCSTSGGSKAMVALQQTLLRTHSIAQLANAAAARKFEKTLAANAKFAAAQREIRRGAANASSAKEAVDRVLASAPTPAAAQRLRDSGLAPVEFVLRAGELARVSAGRVSALNDAGAERLCAELEALGAVLDDRWPEVARQPDLFVTESSPRDSLDLCDLCLRSAAKLDVPKWRGITQLFLFRNRLTELPAEVADLGALRVLDLHGNLLRALPTAALARMPTLEVLDVSYNVLREASLDGATLPVLRELLLHNNLIASLDEQLFECAPAVEIVDLSFNRIAELPDVSAAARIVELSIGYNRVDKLTGSIGSLQELRRLHVEHNKLDFLPPELSGAAAVELFTFDGNPMTSVPKQVLSGGWKELVPYLRALRRGSERFSTVKLMFFGDGAVGKTSLLRSLRIAQGAKPREARQKVKKAAKKLTDLDNMATDGIDISDWESSGVTFRSWDFAGQEVYYNTHAFFLSEHSLFLVCFNMADRAGLKRVDYWLRSLDRFNSPIFVIGTHADLPECAAANFQKQLFAHLRQKYRRFDIVNFVAVSSDNGSGIPELQSALVKAATQRKLVNQEIPLPYMLLIEQIEQLKKRPYGLSSSSPASSTPAAAAASGSSERLRASASSSQGALSDAGSASAATSARATTSLSLPTVDVGASAAAGTGADGGSESLALSPSGESLLPHSAKRVNPVLMWSDFVSMATTFGVDERSVYEVACFLHKIGAIAYFGDDFKLRKYVFLDPQFLAEIFSSIISAKTKLASGMLYHDQLAHMWNSPLFPAELHPVMLKILQKFDVVYPLPPVDGRPVSLVPSLIRNPRPASIEDSWSPANDHTRSWVRQSEIEAGLEFGERIYQFRFLPVGFFSRLIVRVLHIPNIEVSLRWANGLEVRRGDCAALFEFSGDRDLDSRAAASSSSPSSLSSSSSRSSKSSKSLSKSGRSSKSSSSVAASAAAAAVAAIADEATAVDRSRGAFQLRARLRLRPTDGNARGFAMGLFHTIETLIRGWDYTDYLRRVTITCPHCLSSPLSLPSSADMFTWSRRDCMLALAKGHGTVDCLAGAEPVPVSIEEALPEGALSFLDRLRIRKDELHMHDRIARGEGTSVWRATLRSQDVAVKEFDLAAVRSEDDTLEQFDQFRREVMITSKLHHPNLVGLVGFCVDGNCFMMVSPLIPCGDLRLFLNEPENDMSWPMRFKIAADMARGLGYLHATKPPIAHRDMKSPNVLLATVNADEDIVALLADFGLSEFNVMGQNRERDVDCLSEDMQVLTSQGFMFREQVFEALRRDKTLLVAAYNVDGESIVYERPIGIVDKSAKERTFVEFTHPSEVPHWADGSAECGERGLERSAGMSLCVTDGHDMWVEKGAAKPRGGRREGGWHYTYPAPKKGHSSGLAKFKARELVSDSDDVVLRFRNVVSNGIEVPTAGSGSEMSVARRRPVPLAQRVPLLGELGISASSAHHFLWLYGYWLGDGTLQFSTSLERARGRDAVRFAPVKPEHKEMLATKLEALGLKQGVDYHVTRDKPLYKGCKPTGASERIYAVDNENWVCAFFDEYDMTNAAIEQPPQCQAKWCWHWVWKLGRDEVRHVLEGLMFADGTRRRKSPSDLLSGEIYASSPAFRDEIVRMVLHAGYSPLFRPKYNKGAKRGNGREFDAGHDSWRVMVNSGRQCVLRPAESVRAETRNERAWCLTMPSGTLIVRRAFATTVRSGDASFDVVTKASRPTVAGNCPLWLAPEVMGSRGEMTIRSDIYSYGIILWELVGRDMPFSTYEFRWDYELEALIRDGNRPVPPKDPSLWPPAYAALVEACWHNDPLKRPTAEQAVTQLQSIEKAMFGSIKYTAAPLATAGVEPIIVQPPTKRPHPLAAAGAGAAANASPSSAAAALSHSGGSDSPKKTKKGGSKKSLKKAASSSSKRPRRVGSKSSGDSDGSSVILSGSSPAAGSSTARSASQHDAKVTRVIGAGGSGSRSGDSDSVSEGVGVTALCYVASASQLWVGCADGTICVYSCTLSGGVGKLVTRIALDKGHTSACTLLVEVDGGATICSAARHDPTLLLWSTSAAAASKIKKPSSLIKLGDAVSAMAALSDTLLVVGSAHSSQVSTIMPDKGKPQSMMRLDSSEAVSMLTVVDNEVWVACASTIFVVEPSNMSTLDVLADHTNAVTALAPVRAGLVWSAARDQTLLLWNRASTDAGEVPSSAATAADALVQRRYRVQFKVSLDSYVVCAHIIDQRLWTTLANDTSVCVYHPTSGRLLENIEAPENSVEDIRQFVPIVAASAPAVSSTNNNNKATVVAGDSLAPTLLTLTVTFDYTTELGDRMLASLSLDNRLRSSTGSLPLSAVSSRRQPSSDNPARISTSSSSPVRPGSSSAAPSSPRTSSKKSRSSKKKKSSKSDKK
jgi:Leucine-rich repeat (LRR) protein/tRNA A-37 threonylcarbamoyl transferase component Bud32